MSYPGVYLQLLIAVSALCLCAVSQSSSVIVEESRDPYILLATQQKILRMNLDGTNVTTLIDDSIVAFDYHYEKNLIFWVTRFNSDLKRASLSDGSHNVSLRLTNIRKPTGIAVDWLNDKVYWSDRELKGIFAYDLNTNKTNKIADLKDSTPQRLKIFPQTDAGWLYFGDRDVDRKGVYRIEISTGEEMQVAGGGGCPTSISLDFTTRDLYWTDICKYEIKTSKIDGSHLQILSSNMKFSYGLSVYNNHLFLTQSVDSSTNVDCIERRTATNHKIYTTKLTIQDLEIVHPSLQPSMEVLGTFAKCQQGCVNGNCMHTDVCTCYEGWTGPSCEIDINECEELTSGCEQECVNINGGFQCECNNGGLVLAEDQKSCVSPSITTEAVTMPPPTSTSRPTTSSTTPRPTTSPATSHPTTLPTTATPRPTTPSATSHPTTPPTTATPLPTTPPTTHPPTTPPTSSRPTSQPSTTPSNSSPSAPTETTPTATTIGTTTEDTTTSKTDLEPTTTQDPRLPPDDGLKTRNEMSGTTKLILIVVFTAVGFVIIVGVTLYLVFLFFKYKRGKTGSYDVYERHNSPRSQLDAQRTRLQSMVESGTSSTHSSFRDITEQCNRTRLLSGVMSVPADSMRAGSVSASVREGSVPASTREGSVPASVREGSVVSGDSSTDEYRWSEASVGLMTGLLTVPRVHQGLHSTFKQSL